MVPLLEATARGGLILWLPEMPHGNLCARGSECDEAESLVEMKLLGSDGQSDFWYRPREKLGRRGSVQNYSVLNQ